MKRKVRRRAERIKLVLMDCDGVLTDGRIWLTAEGEEQKSFHVRDGQGIKLLHDAGLATGIISGRTSLATARRAAELSMTYVRHGAQNKVAALKKILKEADIKAEECAYLGDDDGDIAIMRHVGLAVAVADAAERTKQVAHYVTKARGGRGAVRELSELIISIQAEAKRKRSFKDRFDELWAAIAGPIFAAFIAELLLVLVSKVHWSLPMVIVALQFVLIVWLLFKLARWPATRYPVSMTLSLFGTVIFVGAVACSGLSYLICSRNPAAYSVSTAIEIDRFNTFYVWYFVDMLPLKIWETLKVDAPIKVATRLGAAPLLLFRIVVATPVLILVPKWYKSRFSTSTYN